MTDEEALQLALALSAVDMDHGDSSGGSTSGDDSGAEDGHGAGAASTTWDCAFCSFANSTSEAICVACDGPRLDDMSDSTDTDGDDGAPTPHDTGAAAASSAAPVRAANAAAANPSSRSGWSCSACTYENDAAATACAMCGHHHAGGSTAAPTPAPSPVSSHGPSRSTRTSFRASGHRHNSSARRAPPTAVAAAAAATPCGGRTSRPQAPQPAQTHPSRVDHNPTSWPGLPAAAPAPATGAAVPHQARRRGGRGIARGPSGAPARWPSLAEASSRSQHVAAGAWDVEPPAVPVRGRAARPWSCTVCTFDNTATALACGMCGKPKA